MKPWNDVLTDTNAIKIQNWQYEDNWPIYTSPSVPPTWWPLHNQNPPSPWPPGIAFPISKTHINYFWDAYFDDLAPGKYERIEEPSLSRNCHGYSTGHPAWFPPNILWSFKVLLEDDFVEVYPANVTPGDIVLPGLPELKDLYHSVRVDAVHTSTIYINGNPITFRHLAVTTEKQGSSGVYRRVYEDYPYVWAPPTVISDQISTVRYMRRQ